MSEINKWEGTGNMEVTGRENQRGEKNIQKKFELMAKIRVAAGAWFTEN